MSAVWGGWSFLKNLLFTVIHHGVWSLILDPPPCKPHIWENSYSLHLCAKALDQSDGLVFQITISFEPFNHFYIFLHKYRIPFDVLGNVVTFLEKCLFAPKKDKKERKWAKGTTNRVFGLLWKIESLGFASNGLKWSVL